MNNRLLTHIYTIYSVVVISLLSYIFVYLLAKNMSCYVCYSMYDIYNNNKNNNNIYNKKQQQKQLQEKHIYKYMSDSLQGKDIYNIKQKTVKVFVTDGENLSQGTGVMYKKDLVLTVAHMFRFGTQLGVQRYGELELLPAIFIASSSVVDVAIFMVSGLNAEKLSISTNIVVGEVVTLVGNPRDADFVVINSIVLGFYRMISPNLFLLKLAEFVMVEGQGIEPGFSGAGLFRNENEIIGIMSICTPTSISFLSRCGAVSGRQILDTLKQFGVD